MRLYVLNGGELYAEKGFFWHFGTLEDTGKDYEPELRVLHSTQYFIDHPEAKILFELGFTNEEFSHVQGFPHRRGPDGRYHNQRADENPIAQLAKIGVSPDDIDYVVLSHLMSDHAGHLPEFAGKKAQIIVQKQEYEYATRIGSPRRPDEEPAVEQFHSWMYSRPNFEAPGLNFRFIEGDYDLIEGEVSIRHTPGHTPGYQGMLLHLPNTGPVYLGGCDTLDMYYATPLRGHGPGIPHSMTWSATGELHSLKAVRDLIGGLDGQIFCGHDHGQFLDLKHLPEYYE
jgi:N-acyl homoserine lactone hydrolase